MNLCGDVLETERGERMVCSLPANHEGSHESQDWEWWEGVEMRITAEKQWHPSPAALQLWRIQDRIERHIFSGPAREAAALKEWRKEWLLTTEHWKWAKAQVKE